MGKYRTLQAVKEWNKLAKDNYKINYTIKSNYNAFKKDLWENGYLRHIELKSYQSKDGLTHVIEF